MSFRRTHQTTEETPSGMRRGPGVIAVIAGTVLSVLTALGVVFSACSSKDTPPDRRQTGTDGTSQSSGGAGGNATTTSGDSGVTANGGAAQTGSGGSGGVASRPYAPSCADQACTSDEQCVDGPAGTYCVHACPGQPCPPGDAQVSYCTRTGGVICLAQ